MKIKLFGGVRDLHIIIVWTLVAMLTSHFFNNMGIVLALPFVFLLPGYAATAAFFPKGVLRNVERLIMGIGASIALTIVGGLLLNRTPSGLTASSWTLLLGVLTLCLSLAGLMRGNSYLIPGLPSWRIGLSVPQVLLFGLAATLTVGAFVFSSVDAANSQSSGAVQLWLLPSTSSQTAQQTVTIGVDNLEATPIQGTIIAMLGDQAIQMPLPSLTLDAGAHWQTTLTLPTVSGTTSVLLTVSLVGTGISTSFTRHVSLWVAPASSLLTPTATTSPGGVTP